MFAGISRRAIFSKIVIAACCSTQQTIDLPALVSAELLANEADYLLAQPVARSRPCLCTVQMFYALVQIAELECFDAIRHQCADALLQRVEKCQHVSAGSFF